MPDDLENTIRENATKPAKASNDSGSVEQHPLRDQMELVRFENSKKAAKAKGFGLRVSKMVPPGTE